MSKKYIEREPLIADLELLAKYENGERQQGVLGVCETIRNRKAADVVEVRHGEWVEGAEHFTNGFYEAECSECGNYIRWNEGNSGEWNYCPNCGAKMDGKGKDNV